MSHQETIEGTAQSTPECTALLSAFVPYVSLASVYGTEEKCRVGGGFSFIKLDYFSVVKFEL